MRTVRVAVQEYLAMRRGLGYKLGVEGRMLRDFVSHLEEHGYSYVTVEAALQWATLPAGADPAWWAARLTVVRGLARYLSQMDERTEIPPSDLLPRGQARTQPYLYSPEQISELLAAARKLAWPLRAVTFETFIGLMATTGLRTGEAMGLDRDQVDLNEGVLLIHGSKFGKSRLVPLHDSTIKQVHQYQRRRDELCPRPSTQAFFVSGIGTRLNHTSVSTTFNRLLEIAGIMVPPGAAKPRLYDLRHSFAVNTMTAWYATGQNVAHKLPSLSTYLGHVSPATTYWYLHACPQLMTAAAERLEKSWKAGPS